MVQYFVNGEKVTSTDYLDTSQIKRGRGRPKGVKMDKCNLKQNKLTDDPEYYKKKMRTFRENKINNTFFFVKINGVNYLFDEKIKAKRVSIEDLKKNEEQYLFIKK